MSILDTAIIQLRRYIDHRLALQEPFRSTVAGTDGDLVLITRPGASTADAEPAAKVTSDVLASGDEVMVVPVLGKPVVIGRVRRTAAPAGGGGDVVTTGDRGPDTQTTLVGTRVDVFDVPFHLDPGSWQVTFDTSGAMKRSVNSGTLSMSVNIRNPGGTDITFDDVSIGTDIHDMTQTHWMRVMGSHEVASGGGDWTMHMSIVAGGTAGTTYLRAPQSTIICVRT